jgi:two-component system response regulator YesN
VAAIQHAIRGAGVRSNGPIQAVARLIHQRYWDELSLAELGREVGRSPDWLSRRFRSVMGVTFRSYVTQIRLERAQSLLVSGTASITEIAQSVGFGDLPRFDKLFKRAMGCTPSAYRRSGRIEETA